MSPTLALKSRLSRALVKASTSGSAMAAHPYRRTAVTRSHRKVSIGSDMDIFPVQLPQDPEEKEGILLLLGMSTIVKKEMASNTEIFEEVEPDESDRLQLDQYLSTLRKRPFAGSPSSHLEDENLFAWSRARTVSMDSPKNHAASPKHVPSELLSLNLPAIVTPVGPSRLRNARRSNQRLVPHKGKKEKVKLPKLPQLHRHPQQLQQHQEPEESVHERHRKAHKLSVERGIPITTIHRKKFSWKNYPGMLNSYRSQKMDLFLIQWSNTHLPPLSRRTGGLFDCQSRRVLAAFCSELHRSTEAVQ
jgi:hypothetical protein